MQDLPFLRRARAVRWQLALSAASYTLLASFLSSRESLLPMNTLLLKQCEIQVEHDRDPLPFVPACVVLDGDNSFPSKKRARGEVDINWAAPVPKEARRLEAGEETTDSDAVRADKLPFPSFYLEEEYGSTKEAGRAKVKVEFNRALLINGFRRFEAIEQKRNYEVGLIQELENEGTANERAASGSKPQDTPGTEEAPVAPVNPLEPSILLSTLCAASSPGPHLSMGRSVDAAAIWEESAVGLTCAHLCPPDGRRVAGGCDDSAVRIWSMFDSKTSTKAAQDTSNDDSKADEGVHEASMVLLGHKNGFPVFDVNWNPDGRFLLSAGGDGSVRLWDTMAKGTFGNVPNVAPRRKSLTSATSMTLTSPPAVPGVTPRKAEEEPGMPVPGARAEPSFETANGAALAVYRGHSPFCPVWSVAFAPSGYYFCSAGADGTARLWVTDRPVPMRIFTGHSSASVNTTAWHPNVNYVLTGCDDKTVRMWDIHTGRCVRLLNGCTTGVNCISVCPSGRYAAAADYSGTIHLWDLGSSKKLRELRVDGGHVNASATTTTSKQKQQQQQVQRHQQQSIHSLSYSSCGTALASGGDDCVVRIWDVRGAGASTTTSSVTIPAATKGASTSNVTTSSAKSPFLGPYASFPTRRTVLLDLQFTKRNLLLSVGKYTTPVPLVVPVDD